MKLEESDKIGIIGDTPSESKKSECKNIGSGIYQIKNLVNGKSYIGSSNNIKKRWTVHISRLNKNRHANPHLQNAWNKYGKNNFLFEILHEVSECCLVNVEQQYLNNIKLNPRRYYNVVYDAAAPSRGKRAPEKTRKKMSMAHSGKRNHFYGKHHTAESNLKNRNFHIGLYDGSKHPSYDFNKYRWYNSDLGISEECTRYELQIKYRLDSGNLSNVVNKKRKSHMGWKIL